MVANASNPVRSLLLVGFVALGAILLGAPAAQAAPVSGTIDPLPIAIAGSATISGTAFDGGGGAVRTDVRLAGPASADVCLNRSGSPWSCDFDTFMFPDGTYTVTATFFDTGSGSLTASQTVTIDNSAPTAVFAGFIEQSNAAFQHSVGSTHFFNPNMSGSFRAGVSATDAGIGVQHVAFPALGTGWTPGSAYMQPLGMPAYDVTYAWTPGPAPAGPVIATAFDNAGASATVNFSVVSDGAAPSGGSATATSSGGPATITFTVGADSQSGVGSYQLQRRQATSGAGTCGAFGAWSNIGPTNPSSPFTDATVIASTCYEYRLNVIDNVGNQAIYVASGVVGGASPADTTNPSGFVSGSPVGPVSSQVTLTGGASDTVGVARIDLSHGGGSAADSICTRAFAGQSSVSWSCPWDTTAMPDGMYVLTLLVTDLSGNTATVTRTLFVDNHVPTIALTSFVEVTGVAYQHSIGSTHYVNATQSGSFTVNVAASDAGTGIDRVDFPALPSGWTPSSGLADNAAPFAASVAWTFAAASPGLRTITALDFGGNSATTTYSIVADTLAPTGATIAASNGGGDTVATVTHAGGSDSGSGVAARVLQRREAGEVAGSCSPFGAWAQVGASNPASPYADATLAAGTCYQYRLLVRDNVGNEAVFADGGTLITDDEVAGPGPVPAIVGFTPDTGVTHQQVDGSTLWYDPAHAGSAWLDIDPGVGGIDRANFARGTDGWTPLTATNIYAGPWRLLYSWSAGATEPGSRRVIVYPTDGSDPINLGFALRADTVGPVGGTISYPDAATSAATTTIAFTPGADAGSGVASWYLQRRTAPLAAGTCGAWSAWAQVGATDPASPFSDGTLTDGTCAAYQLAVTDGFGHVSTVATAAMVRVDRVAPVGSFDAAAPNATSPTVTLSGTVHDLGTGVQAARVTFHASSDGVACESVTIVGGAWSCAWNRTGVPAGAWELRLEIIDQAGNTHVVARPIDLDAVVVPPAPPAPTPTTGGGATTTPPPSTTPPATTTPRGPKLTIRLGKLPAVTWGTSTTLDWRGDDEAETVTVERRERSATAETWGAWRPAGGDVQSGDDLRLTPGSTSCFRVAAIDLTGQRSTSPERCTAVAFDDRRLRRSGTWQPLADARARFGTLLRSRSAGAALEVTTARSRITIVAATCPACGTVRVMHGNRLLRTITLTARRASFAKPFTVRLPADASRAPLRLVAVDWREVRIDAVVAQG
ncbi:MAG: laminin sub domain 2 [Thermoleophilia bacterium]|nr:laminin sub domain 2 [Thermoleophilia bacterium]